MSDLRYPLGRYEAPDPVTAAQRAAWIADLAAAPAALRAAVEGLSDDRLDTPYRPGGWTVRQVVHHVPDSHLNAYCRFKLALTEDAPTIKPYEEARWAELPDSAGPVAPSLDILDGLHARWVALLRAMPEAAWSRTFVHPEHGRALRLDWTLGLYAWHGKHHTAHVTALRDREGW
jgi:hypothetical protein